MIIVEETLSSKDLENEKLLRQIALLAEQIDKSAKIIALQDEALALAEQQATLRALKLATIDSDMGSNESDAETVVESSNNNVQALVLASSQDASTSKDSPDQVSVAGQTGNGGVLSTTTNQPDAEPTVKSSNDNVQTLVLADSQGALPSKDSTDQAMVAEQELHLSKNKHLFIILGVAAISALLIVFLIRRGRQQVLESAGILKGDDERDAMTAATQLDLARAYIEMGAHSAARNALDDVVLHGDVDQKASAQGMLTELQTKNREYFY